MVSAAGTPQPWQQRELMALNADRMRKISIRIQVILRTRAGVVPSAELTNLVYALARGIDFAVSAGDVPPIAADVPHILRKVYDLRKEPSIQSPIMVLIISCKNACSNKWFQPADSVDILRMANELSGNFCTSLDQATNNIIVIGIISKIMPRYYPQLKFERLVTSMEAKVGYDVLMVDFFIERNLPPEEKIRLIVVQKENFDASSCITSPPLVSFLVNGKGVGMRTNVSMEPGPQFPTDITKMLKYGANIIQAVGYFNANYIIAVAFMKSLTSLSTPALDNYAEPVTFDPSDSDVLEGPSRVSLKCPISLRRIKTPVKGYLCKHYQCFDYDNYIEMNLRKPTWRCPYCNTPSNFMELRIDRKIAEILQETGVGVLDVLLFADGSWKADQANKDNSDRHTADAIQLDRDNVQTDSSSSSHIVDLVSGNNDLWMNWSSASQDKKPVLNSQDLSMLEYLPDLPIKGPVRAGSTSSNMVSTSSQTLSLPSSTRHVSSSFGTMEPLRPHAVVTGALSLGSSNSTSEGSTPIPRNPRSETVGVQEFSVQPQNSWSSGRLQPSLPRPTPSTYEAHKVTNASSVIAPVNNDGGFLPRALAPSASQLLRQHPTALDTTNNRSSHLPNQAVGLPEPHLMGLQKSAGVPRQTGGANAYLSMPVLNELMLQNRVHQTAQVARGQTILSPQVGPAQADIQGHASRPQTMAQAATSEVVPREPLHMQSAREPVVVPSMPQAGPYDTLPELPVDENWRPTGQMRGSLTGNAYNHAIESYLGLAAQEQSKARSPRASDGKRPH